jgi:hypothetical protein
MKKILKILLFLSSSIQILAFEAATSSNSNIQTPAEFKQNFKYSINLMWINRELKQEYLIFPNKTQIDFPQTSDDFFNVICKWAAKNPNATINIWFDSRFVEKNSIDNTYKKIDDELKKCNITSTINLKDIRDLNYVKNRENEKIFSTEANLWFRVDILRIIAANEEIKKNSDFFIYTDWDIKPMNSSELFDNQTIENLEKYGFIMGVDSDTNIENSFFINGNSNKNFIQAQQFLIERNILKCKQNLERKMICRFGVFNDYITLMLYYFNHLEKNGTLYHTGTTSNYIESSIESEYEECNIIQDNDTNTHKQSIENLNLETICRIPENCFIYQLPPKNNSLMSLTLPFKLVIVPKSKFLYT